MKKGDLTNIDGELCTKKQENGEEITFGLTETEEARKNAEEMYGFRTTYDADGGEHFGIWVSEEHLEKRLKHLRNFYQEGMIPWVCPSCGKLWGGHYDVGSMTWFKCHTCGAQWELINPEEVAENIERAKKPKLEVLR